MEWPRTREVQPDLLLGRSGYASGKHTEGWRFHKTDKLCLGIRLVQGVVRGPTSVLFRPQGLEFQLLIDGYLHGL